MEVVSNSSPLIHLAKTGRLNLLEALYGQVSIPEKVYLECTDTVHHREEVEAISQTDLIKRHSIEDKRLSRLLYSEIDAGEAEALVLALESSADLILLDDQEARNKARKLELPVTGTLGVLLKAHTKGLIDSLEDEIYKLQTSGFWLSQSIIDTVLSWSNERS